MHTHGLYRSLSKVILRMRNYQIISSQPVRHYPFGGSNDPFTEITYQISNISDIYVTISSCSKITVMKDQRNSFMVGVTTM